VRRCRDDNSFRPAPLDELIEGRVGGKARLALEGRPPLGGRVAAADRLGVGNAPCRGHVEGLRRPAEPDEAEPHAPPQVPAETGDAAKIASGSRAKCSGTGQIPYTDSFGSPPSSIERTSSLRARSTSWRARGAWLPTR